MKDTMAPGDAPATKQDLLTLFFRLRRAARMLDYRMNSLHDEARRLERKAKLLELESPFNRGRAVLLRAAAQGYKDSLLPMGADRRQCGEYLIQALSSLDKHMSLAERLDLINANVADRKALDGDDPETLGLHYLVFAHHLEDSAAHRGKDFYDAPMFTAIQRHMMHAMTTTPEGQEALDKLTEELFAPGGMFHGLPVYYRQEDGTMVRKSADLMIHDKSGSKVVRRPAGR